MPGTKKPEDPYFEVKEGQVKVGKWSMPLEDFQAEVVTEERLAKDNAAVEGEEAEDAVPVETGTKPLPEPEEEKEPEEEETEEAEAEEKVPETKEPDKLKFKQKFRGEEYEVELTPEQIASRLQILRSYQENEKEFWDQKKKVETFSTIIESDRFKEWIREQREAGEQIPEPKQPSTDEQMLDYEIAKRRDPKVLIQLREWAMDNLSPEQIQVLDSNPKVYISEYDRVAAELKPKEPEPPKEKVDPKVKEKILKSKEVVKERAAVEKPGVKTEVDPMAAQKKREKFLERLVREGNRGQSDDAALELAYLRYFKPYEK